MKKFKNIISIILSGAMIVSSLPVLAEENTDVETVLPWEEEEIGSGEIAEPAKVDYPDAEMPAEQEIPEYEPIVHTEEIPKDIEFPDEDYSLLPNGINDPEKANMFSLEARDAASDWDSMYSGRYGEDYFEPYMRNGDGIRITGDTNRLVIEQTDLTLPGKNGLDLVITRKYDNQGSRRVLTVGDGADRSENWYYVYTFRNTDTGDEVKIGFNTKDMMYKYAYNGFESHLLEPKNSTGISADSGDDDFYYFQYVYNNGHTYTYELVKEIPYDKVKVENYGLAMYSVTSNQQFQSRDYLSDNWSLVIPEAAAMVYSYESYEHYSNTVYRYFLTGTFRDIYGGVHSFKGDETYTKYDAIDRPNTYVSVYEPDNAGEDLNYESIFDSSSSGNEHIVNGRYYNFKVIDDRGLTYYLWNKDVENGLEKPSENDSRQMYVIAVEDDYGNMIEYYYDENYNKLEKIIDTYGREIVFEEINGGSRLSYYDDQTGKTKYITYLSETLPASSLENDSILVHEPVQRFTVINENGEKTIYDSRVGETVNYVERDKAYDVNQIPHITTEWIETGTVKKVL